MRSAQALAAKLVITLVTVLSGSAILLIPNTALARTAPDSATEKSIELAQLPPQGRLVMTQIFKGGPFQYEKDGVVFGNRERFLPFHPRGYYREYTVKTPYERSRGARRIVCGGLKPVEPDACYYTDDHYASFRKIVQ